MYIYANDDATATSSSPPESSSAMFSNFHYNGTPFRVVLALSLCIPTRARYIGTRYSEESAFDAYSTTVFSFIFRSIQFYLRFLYRFCFSVRAIITTLRWEIDVKSVFHSFTVDYLPSFLFNGSWEILRQFFTVKITTGTDLSTLKKRLDQFLQAWYKILLRT